MCSTGRLTINHLAPTILKTLRPTILPSAATSSALLPSTFSLLPLASPYRHASTKHGKKLNLGKARKAGVQTRRPEDLHQSGEGDLTNPERRGEIEADLRKRLTSTPLESDSIFAGDLKNIPDEDAQDPDAAVEGEGGPRARETIMGASLIADHVRHAVDPDPRSRRRWERKMVIRHVERCLHPKGEETKEERIKRTEREVLSKSTLLPTSVKKLMYLARQISGKTFEEARTQMKFSKKKFAKEVLYELELARDKAVVERGMGLGKATGEYVPGKTEKTTIRDHRNGKWVDVVDPTRLYVDEAWVGRGPWRGKRPSYRARGRTDIIQMPQASKWLRASSPWLTQLTLFHRYNHPSQGGEDQGERSRGEEGEGTQEGPVDPPARQARHCSTSFLHLVDGHKGKLEHCLSV